MYQTPRSRSRGPQPMVYCPSRHLSQESCPLVTVLSYIFPCNFWLIRLKEHVCLLFPPPYADLAIVPLPPAVSGGFLFSQAQCRCFSRAQERRSGSDCWNRQTCPAQSSARRISLVSHLKFLCLSESCWKTLSKRVIYCAMISRPRRLNRNMFKTIRL